MLVQHPPRAEVAAQDQQRELGQHVDAGADRGHPAAPQAGPFVVQQPQRHVDRDHQEADHERARHALAREQDRAQGGVHGAAVAAEQCRPQAAVHRARFAAKKNIFFTFHASH